MFNKKIITVLILLSVFVVGLTIAPVSAALNVDYLSTMTNKPILGESELVFSINTDIVTEYPDPDSDEYGKDIEKELDSINKIIIKIKGYKPVTIKKPTTGWPISYIEPQLQDTFIVKGKVINKAYVIKLYDKKDKLLKTKKGKISLINELPWDGGSFKVKGEIINYYTYYDSYNDASTKEDKNKFHVTYYFDKYYYKDNFFDRDYLFKKTSKNTLKVYSVKYDTKTKKLTYKHLKTHKTNKTPYVFYKTYYIQYLNNKVKYEAEKFLDKKKI